uniref:Parvalbumin n=1 Tax=Oryzias latipes TaxID=8090 RepID=A0A3P9II79_ORYLA
RLIRQVRNSRRRLLWLQENLIPGHTGNSSILERILPSVYKKTVNSHQTALIFCFGPEGRGADSAPDSFSFKKFSQLCGLSSKTPQEIRDVFQILDEDNSGYIEESELKFFLQRFLPGARTLTEAETKSFISAADDNSDGRIGVDEFQAMVLS